jgi:hypothetical protein
MAEECGVSEQDSDAKIHIDSDWKEEARREKERLAEQEQAAAKTGPLPDPSFMEIVNMIAMQAAMCMSDQKLATGEVLKPDLPTAKHLIGLLEVLEVKTKDNLNDEEQRALGGVLYELRMRYVQAMQPPPAGTQ